MYKNFKKERKERFASTEIAASSDNETLYLSKGRFQRVKEADAKEAGHSVNGYYHGANASICVRAFTNT